MSVDRWTTDKALAGENLLLTASTHVTETEAVLNNFNELDLIAAIENISRKIHKHNESNQVGGVESKTPENEK